MNSELEEHLKFHTNLNIGGWSASNDIIIRELQRNMRWINSDPVYKAKIKLLRQARRPILLCSISQCGDLCHRCLGVYYLHRPPIQRTAQ
ncbi:hypothetical protein M431DRAFT_505938 [Trichoderma harzianum CBS 226.95]|uniref:Uncharacterized protein n=1 Tax=Trichoderma harzianum CBS 226.95 TaxID=983964 RepID=A0A2T4AND6_TRIHA|nr:hypothetical protein M431DRAFT_505938 [Trichoderma harzianum CBS 226.95]PTB58438.1 hypothetical protein M431DRAFT_505938 [Trichoderma harzianum CBS 226.95]